MAAEFLPRERQLFVVVADDDSNIAVLEYNPDSERTSASISPECEQS